LSVALQSSHFCLASGKPSRAKTAAADPGARDETVPFSFIYANQSSEQILSRWKRSETKKVLPDERIQTITRYTDPATGLEVTWEATEFAALGAVEWVVRLRNTGSMDTPIIEKLLALDQKISVPAGTVVFSSCPWQCGLSRT